MKKTIIAVFALAFFLGATGAGAQQEENEYKAEDIKIHKKIKITPEQKSYLEQKGKPDSKGKPSNPLPSVEAATGVLGAKVTGDKYAVVIGICDYPGTGSDICDSDGDALNMEAALVTEYAFSADNIYPFRDEDAIKGNIYQKILDLQEIVTPDDEVVFFFSGHGTSAKVNDGDSEKIDEGIVIYGSNNTFDYIWDGELNNWFSGFETSRIVFIFDSCLAGGMNDVADDGRVVVMSSKENQNSYVFSGGANGEGVFSHWFVNLGMLQGKADGVNQLNKTDGDVAVEESFQYTKNIVYTLQVPVLSDYFKDDLLLGNYSN